jgi:hypothetical protein
MLKKIVAGIIALSLIAPSVALADGRHHNRHNSGHHHHHHHNKNNWVAPLVGGLVIGGIIANQNRSYYYTPPPVYYHPQPRYDYSYPVQCVERWVTEYDGWGNRYQTLIRECY